MRNVNEIIIHCSATPEGRNFKASDIDHWHRQRGFKKIGYHYVIDLDGTIEVGRDEDEIGAHCVGHNRESIGICYIGGLDCNLKPKDTRTEAQKASLRQLVKNLIVRYPCATLHGHCEFAKKTCPCFDVASILKTTTTD